MVNEVPSPIEQALFRLLASGAPNDCVDLRGRVARYLADTLLEKLDDPLSPEGALFDAVCEEMAAPVIRQLQEGA